MNRCRPKMFRRPPAPLLLALAFLSGCFTVPPPIESHFNRGVELYDEGKYAEAIEEYKLALRRDPDDLFAKYNLAVVYQDQEKYDRAEKLYREILDQTEDTRSRVNLAAIHYVRGDREAAYAELKQAARHNPDSAVPWSALGEYRQREKDFDRAENHYLQALEIDDQHAPTHHRLGRLLCETERPGPCRTHLEKAVALEPEEPLYLDTLAGFHETQGEAYEAIHLLERLSVLEPDREEIYVRLGDLYRSKGHYPEAVKRYWSALALRRDNPHVHRNLQEIFETLADQEKEELERIENQSSFAKTP